MRKFIRSPFSLTILFSLFSLSTATDTLTPGHALSDGQTLVSYDRTFALGFFAPSETNNRYIGIWYNKIPRQTIAWVANRGNPITDSAAILTITTEGTLLIFTNNRSTIVWSSMLAPMAALRSPVAQLLDTGNLVVREANNSNSNLDTFAWQSFDHPTNALLPGMKLGLNLTSGLNRNLISWLSPTDPSPGNYTLSVDSRGVPQLTLWAGLARMWRSGPWTGVGFNGDPDTSTFSNVFTVSFVSNNEEVYYTIAVVNSSDTAHLVINQTGIIQGLVWLDELGDWDLILSTPQSQCDKFNSCGSYGVCYPNGDPMCGCLPGFQPKSPASWDLRDFSDGCVRKTALDCGNHTDGFLSMQRMRVPDTVSAIEDPTMSHDRCMAQCLGNCSCIGFASADTRGIGSGCIIWYADNVDMVQYSNGGSEFYLRLAAADIADLSRQPHKRSRKATLTMVLGTVSGILLLACVILYIWRKRMRRSGSSSLNVESMVETNREDEMELPVFDLETIMAATENFSNENKIGQGGFGPVYKGKMKEGQEIAVKRLSKTSVQGRDEFMTEVMLVAKLQHRNLARLLGCCIQEGERILIYEYMVNKSLDAFLFDSAKVVSLDWQTCYHIIVGIARGLLYLHQDSRFRIIHRDLKASNILLDKDMNPKISDFGLARIFAEDAMITQTRRVVGTYGYMAPEYALDGIFSVKSDVFSFGVLVLEIISGRKNRAVYLAEPHENLLAHAWSLWNEGNGLQLVSESMDCASSLSKVLTCIKVGLLCVQGRPEDRPTMSAVVWMLGGDHASLPEPEQPGFVARKNSLRECLSPGEQILCSLNGLTLTTPLGR